MTSCFNFTPENFQSETPQNANSAKAANPSPNVSKISDISSAPCKISDYYETYQERAAIRQFDAGMTRDEAEAAAFADCQRIRGEYGQKD